MLVFDSRGENAVALLEKDPNVDLQDAQDIVDRYLAHIWSDHPLPRSRLRPRSRFTIPVLTHVTWRKVGQALRLRFLQAACDGCDCSSCRSPSTKGEQRANYWVAVLSSASNGDPSSLVKHFNSRKAITQSDRRILAELFDGHFKGEFRRAPSRGRPRDSAIRSNAQFAVLIYRHWKTINRQWRIKDWGHSDAMKDEACRIAVDRHLKNREWLLAFREGRLDLDDPEIEVPDFEKVRELMERPNSRRR